MSGQPLPAPRRTAVLATLAILFAVLALLPWLGALGVKGYVLSFATRMMIFAIAAVSLDFILGFGGLVSFGHAAYLGIGAYAAGILVAEGQEDAFVGLAVALVVAAGFAAATGAIAMRTKGVAFIMITLAFGQMAYFVANALSEYGGSDGLTLWTRSTVAGQKLLKSETVFYYVVLGCLVACTALVLALTESRFGRALRASRENPARVAALGYDVDRIRLAAYVVSAMLCAVAGFLLANQSSFVSPGVMSWQRSGELIVMVVLGGMGTVAGAIVGAFAFLLLEELLSLVTVHWKLVFGPFLVLVVLLGRGGLMGFLRGGGRG
jgi:branched-chain amino acid transport system permease protein